MSLSTAAARAPASPTMARLATLRQGAYRLLSSTLLYPETERLTLVKVAALYLDGESEFLGGSAFHVAWKRLVAALAAVKEGSAGALQERYVSLFLLKGDAAPCFPYESAYVPMARRAPGLAMAALDAEYAAEGLSLSRSISEPPDHVSVELEFMSFLCGREAQAWQKRQAKVALSLVAREATFLRGHLGIWLPHFSEMVHARDGRGLYDAAVEATWAFVSHDAALLDAIAQAFRRVAMGSR